MSLYILQYRGTSLISRLIRSITWSNFSHSAIANAEGYVIEAWEKAGISYAASPWENHTPGTVISVYKLAAEGKEMRIWNEALLRCGGEYDFMSIFGFLPILRHFWSDDVNRFFCSHLVAYCCRRGGAPLFSQATPLYKVSPGLLTWSPRLKWIADVKNDDEWDEVVVDNLQSLGPAQ